MPETVQFDPARQLPESAAAAELREYSDAGYVLSRSGFRADRSAVARRSRSETLTLLIGRAVFGGYFLYNGINHFRNRKMMAQYTKSKSVPVPDLAVVASGAMIAAGGVSLLTGTRPKLGVSLIAAFLLGVSPVMHAFWKEEDAQQRMNESIHFTKNLAMLGGALLAAAVPEPWPYAADV